MPKGALSSLNDETWWTSATEAEDQLKGPRQKNAPALVTPSWTCPKKTNSSPEKCQSLSSLPFTLCNLLLSFSGGATKTETQIFTFCFISPCISYAWCLYAAHCPLPTQKPWLPRAGGTPKLLPAPGLLSNRPGEISFNSQSTSPMFSEEGKEGKASSSVTCPCRTPISSPQQDLLLNTNRQSGSKSWGKGGDTCQSAFNLISATCPTGRLCKLKGFC